MATAAQKRQGKAATALDATIAQHKADGAGDYATSHIVFILTEQLRPAPWNPRRDFDPTALGELAASLQRHGMLQPIVARFVAGIDGHYQVLAGERRLRAANIAGLRTIPVHVVDVDDRRAREITVVENAKRADLNPMEAAEAYRLLLDEGMKQTELAAAVKVTQPTIAKTVGLLALPEPVQDLIRAGKLTASHGEVLLNLKSFPEACAAVAELAAEHQASVRAVAKLDYQTLDILVQKKLAVKVWSAPFKDTVCKHCPFHAYRSFDSYSCYCLKPEHFAELSETAKTERQKELEAEVAAANNTRRERRAAA